MHQDKEGSNKTIITPINYQDRKVLSIMFILIIIAILTVAIFVLTYINIFNGSFSKDPATWGQAGDFFGGTLNSLFAFMNLGATIFIAITVSRFNSRDTEKQIEVQKELVNLQVDAQKQLVNMQLKHEVLKDCKNDFYKFLKLAELEADEKHLSDCLSTLMQLSSNYAFLFSASIISYCKDQVTQMQRIIHNENDFRKKTRLISLESRVLFGTITRSITEKAEG
jgi:uncharacterized membrane protein